MVFYYLEKGRRESAESGRMKIQSSPLMWSRCWYQFTGGRRSGLAASSAPCAPADQPTRTVRKHKATAKDKAKGLTQVGPTLSSGLQSWGQQMAKCQIHPLLPAWRALVEDSGFILDAFYSTQLSKPPNCQMGRCRNGYVWILSQNCSCREEDSWYVKEGEKKSQCLLPTHRK